MRLKIWYDVQFLLARVYLLQVYPLWLFLESLAIFCEHLFCIWQFFEPTLAKCLCRNWSNIEQFIRSHCSLCCLVENLLHGLYWYKFKTGLDLLDVVLQIQFSVITWSAYSLSTLMFRVGISLKPRQILYCKN